MLEKEQEDDRTSVDAQIEQKKVKIAESQAEAAKVRQIKHAEADAQSRVLMAKAESDSMQYTLPLKQKQIEQSRLEAEARKEATIKNAEADAAAQVKSAEAAGQAKVINTKADAERSRLLSETQNVLGGEKCGGLGAGENYRFEGRTRASQPAGRRRSAQHSRYVASRSRATAA